MVSKNLAGHKAATDWPVVPRVFIVFFLLKYGDYVSPFPAKGTSLDFSEMTGDGLATSVTSSLRGNLMPAEASLWVLWACTPSGSLDYLKPDLTLQWWFFILS